MLSLLSLERERRKKVETQHQEFFFASFIDGEYRIIEFKEPIENKAMKDHVIRSAEVINEGSCRVMCYMEPTVCPFILDLHKVGNTHVN